MTKEETTTPVARLIVSPEIRDTRGALTFVQEERLPFDVRRLFAIYDVPPGATRGGHAHRSQHQLVMMLAGACRALTDNGKAASEFSLQRPNQALYVPPMVWLDLREFTAPAVCVVLTSGAFDEADYIRDRAAFDQLAGQG